MVQKQKRNKKKELEDYKNIVKIVDKAHKRAMEYIRQSLEKQKDCKVAI